MSFARTGGFDLLVLLGDLGVLELTPPRLYLAGATGPLEGARIVLPDIHDERELDQRLAQIATEFGISITVLEDTLCNWQKHL